jgi:hypothetical protein
MADAAFWIVHLAIAFFGFLLLAVSVRASLTVLCVVAFELVGFIGMFVPGGAGLAFTLAFFALLGLAMGVPFSLGRGRLDWWILPALGVGVFVLLRMTLLLGEEWHAIWLGVPMHLAAVFGLGAGMLAGRGLADLGTRALNRAISRTSNPT